MAFRKAGFPRSRRAPSSTPGHTAAGYRSQPSPPALHGRRDHRPRQPRPPMRRPHAESVGAMARRDRDRCRLARSSQILRSRAARMKYLDGAVGNPSKYLPKSRHLGLATISTPLLSDWFLLHDDGCFSTLPRRDRSHLEKLGIPRLDLLALRQHRSRIGLEQFQRRQRRATWLFLDLRMERTMRIIFDPQLLGLDAEGETLEQPRGVRIRRAAEDAGRNNDER